MMEKNLASHSDVYKKPNQINTLYYLVKRHIMVFFKDKSSVLFTLMVPLVVLAVYAVFLRPMEVKQLDGVISSQLGLNFNPDTANKEVLDLIHKVRGIADEWMISGVISVSCITVSLNTNAVMVHDKETGITKDFSSSPIDPTTTVVSYAIFNALVTFVVNLIVFFVCLIYLWGYGAILPDFVSSLAIIGIIVLSTISATLFTNFICSFINTGSTLASITAIFSAAIGFLCGAYLPASMMPRPVQYLTMFFPGAYSSGLLRNYFMATPFEELHSALLEGSKNGIISASSQEVNEFVKGVEGSFSLDMDFFGLKVSVSIMALIVLIFIGIFLILDIFFTPDSIQRFFKKSRSKRMDNSKDSLPLPEELKDSSNDSIVKLDRSVKNIPASKDNYPFNDGKKDLSSKGHLIDKDK